jgi:hypothetical protein
MDDKNMTVSFLIPALRDFSKYAQKTIDSIAKSNFSFDYEAIVCSKFEVKYDKTVWIKEPEENNGSVLPINLAYQAAKGKYFALLNDDFDIDSSFEHSIKFLESDFYKNRKINLTAFHPDMWIKENDMKWIPDHQGKFLPCRMLCFPIGNKDNIQNNLGPNLLDSRFKHHWSDVWLTFYLYKKYNEIIPLCEKSIITMRKAVTSTFNDHEDKRLYVNLSKNFDNMFYE